MPSGTRAGAGRRDATAARFRALADVARAATSRSGAALLADVARGAMVALDGASASLSRWEPESGQVRCLVNVGQLGPTERADPVDEIYAIADYPGLLTLLEDHSWLIATIDDASDTGYAQVLHDVGKGSCVAAPIPLEGRVWGELFVTRTMDQAPFNDVDAEFTVAVAAQVGAAIATAEHLDRVERLARTDPLTGLANRRAVDDRLDAAFVGHVTDGRSVSLIVCDLNGLKRLNDEHGHDVGDRALVRFARLLSTVASSLPGALAARLGGDEFCLVVDGVSADDVVAAAEELCRLVARSPLDGVACGVASTADDVGEVEGPSRLFRLADAAQYRAKRSRSPRPVAAGRTLPPEAAVRLAERPSPDRRQIRGREVGVGRLLTGGLLALDDLPDATLAQRLAAVGDAVAQHVDGIGWWLSRARAGADHMATVRFAMYRSTQSIEDDDPRVGAVGVQFALADYPLSVQVMNGGAVAVEASDPTAEPSEVAILDGMGAVSLLMGGAVDRAGDRWLLEIFADEISAPVGAVVPVLRALVVVAVAEAGAG